MSTAGQPSTEVPSGSPTSVNMPKAEIDIDEDLVRRLVHEQFTDLSDLTVTKLANGWDNAMFRLGPDMVVRLPRRQVSEVLAQNEARWLPELAPLLPTPIPAPLRVGKPTSIYPWTWLIVPWADGDPGNEQELQNPSQVAQDLGHFLAALHKPAPPSFPANPYRGGPLAQRNQITLDRLRAADLSTSTRTALLNAWEDALSARPWNGPPLWIHGDLHPANIIVNSRGLTAVVDFGDMTGGDPATDLLIAWALLGPSDREVLRRAASSPVRAMDDDLWRRGRGWAISHGLGVNSASADNPAMMAMSTRQLMAVADEFA